jgi:hypothetical protein
VVVVEEVVSLHKLLHLQVPQSFVEGDPAQVDCLQHSRSEDLTPGRLDSVMLVGRRRLLGRFGMGSFEVVRGLPGGLRRCLRCWEMVRIELVAALRRTYSVCSG